jgi:hypothetical protein
MLSSCFLTDHYLYFYNFVIGWLLQWLTTLCCFRKRQGKWLYQLDFHVSFSNFRVSSYLVLDIRDQVRVWIPFLNLAVFKALLGMRWFLVLCFLNFQNLYLFSVELLFWLHKILKYLHKNNQVWKNNEKITFDITNLRMTLWASVGVEPRLNKLSCQYLNFPDLWISLPPLTPTTSKKI